MLFKIKLYENIVKKPTTLRHISRETGLSRPTLQRWMNQTLKQVEIEKVEKLCDYFGVELQDMLEIVETEEQTN